MPNMQKQTSNVERAEALGAYLRKLRLARGMTQEELSSASGIDRNHYQLLEGGISNRSIQAPANPTISTLYGIAEVLEIDITELVRAYAHPEMFPDGEQAVH